MKMNRLSIFAFFLFFFSSLSYAADFKSGDFVVLRNLDNFFEKYKDNLGVVSSVEKCEGKVLRFTVFVGFENEKKRYIPVQIDSVHSLEKGEEEELEKRLELKKFSDQIKREKIRKKSKEEIILRRQFSLEEDGRTTLLVRQVSLEEIGPCSRIKESFL